jgi:hypothetical protein
MKEGTMAGKAKERKRRDEKKRQRKGKGGKRYGIVS